MMGSNSKLVFLLRIILLSALACNVPQTFTNEEFTETAPVSEPDQAGKEPVGEPTDQADNFSSQTTSSPQDDVSLQVEICSGSGKSIVLLIDPTLIEGIRNRLDQFENDLCHEGYSVIERSANFITPIEVRAYLAELYNQTEQRLIGAILIGSIPYAYQWFTVEYTNPNIPPSSEEVISYQYYSDLDGVFEASPDYISPGGSEYSFDIHSGELNWEIWVGVLPVYKGDINLTMDAINRYFEKNHSYRIGQNEIPRGFQQINEHRTASTSVEHNQAMQDFVSGQYSWTPFSSSGTAYYYFESPTANLSTAQGYSDLSAGVADFTVGDAHGYWGAHGSIDIQWVESNPVRTYFFWSNGCAVGNLDYPNNFISAIIYSPTSMVLVAKGTTNNSGGMGTNQNGFFGHNVATALSQGKSFGEAILDHVNVPLILPWLSSRELHFATSIILGDPTLRIQP